MKLEAGERAALIQLLTISEGKYDAMHTLRRVRGMVGFDAGEMDRLRNDERIEAKEIFLDDWTKSYIADELRQVEAAGKLVMDLLPLYDKFVFADFSDRLDKMDEGEAERLRLDREGKKTVALVGLSLRSCGMAPFQNSDVELWGENESHAFGFFSRATRWFQIHSSYRTKIAKRGIVGHYEWLKANPWGIPIYMQQAKAEIPHSVSYPLDRICNGILWNVKRGRDPIKYFNSSFDYMIALAVLEKFERIEVYGFDMAGDNEYALQKPSAEFWLGIASQNAEIYLPDNCLLLKGELYGGKEQGAGW